MYLCMLHIAFMVSVVSTQNIYCADDNARKYARFEILHPLVHEDDKNKFHVNPFGEVVLPLPDKTFLHMNNDYKDGHIDLTDINELHALAKKHAAAWKQKGKGGLFLEEIDTPIKKISFLNTAIHNDIYCPRVTCPKGAHVLSFYGSSFPCGRSGHHLSPFNVVASHDSEKKRYSITFLNKKNDSKTILYDECKSLKALHNGYIFFLAGIFEETQTHHIYPFSCEVTTTKENLETFMEEIKTKDITSEVKECRGVCTLGMHDPFY